ncbi:MAG: hypothetical protein ACT4PO_05555 [Actinomycetota bacterium]
MYGAQAGARIVTRSPGWLDRTRRNGLVHRRGLWWDLSMSYNLQRTLYYSGTYEEPV